MHVPAKKRRAAERTVRAYIAALAELQDADDRTGRRRISRVDWADIYDRIETYDPQHPDYVLFADRKE